MSLHLPRTATTGTILVLLQVGSFQLGAITAKSAYEVATATQITGMRLVVAATAILAVTRPRVRGRSKAQWGIVLAFGMTIATMNTAFYLALSQLPIAVAVAVELTGPVLFGLGGVRRNVYAWVAAGGCIIGVFLLAGSLTPLPTLGLTYALVAATARALYVHLTHSLSAKDDSAGDFALGLGVAGIFGVPVYLLGPGKPELLARPNIWLVAIAVGLLSSLIPYLLDRAALRRLPVFTFTILVALSPVVSAALAFLALGEHLSPAQAAGGALIVASAIWAAQQAQRPDNRDINVVLNDAPGAAPRTTLVANRPHRRRVCRDKRPRMHTSPHDSTMD